MYLHFKMRSYVRFLMFLKRRLFNAMEDRHFVLYSKDGEQYGGIQYDRSVRDCFLESRLGNWKSDDKVEFYVFVRDGLSVFLGDILL